MDSHERAKSSNVSVIIPVHNGIEHLGECLDSLQVQTMAPLEVICIDDGSTDGSSEYLDARCAGSSLFKVARQEQSGVSAARNRGVGMARGSHVLFVDSDDVADPSLIEVAYTAALDHGADLTIFGFDEFYSRDSATIDREMCDVADLYGRPFTLDELSSRSIPACKIVTPNVWRILFDRAFLARNGLAFHEDLATSEDLAFIYESLIASASLLLLPNRLYHYRRGISSSLTRTPRGSAGFRALDYIVRFSRSRGDFDRCLLHLVNIIVDVACYSMSTAYDRNEYLNLFQEFSGRWRPFIDNHRVLVDPAFLDSLDALDGDPMDFLFQVLDCARMDLDSFRSFETFQRRRADVAEFEANRLRSEVDDLRGSTSYRIGNKLVRIPARLKRLFGSSVE